MQLKGIIETTIVYILLSYIAMLMTSCKCTRTEIVDEVVITNNEKFGIEAVIHMDPACEGGACGTAMGVALRAAKSIDSSATVHDLQIDGGSGKVYFDAVIPFGLETSDEDAARDIEKYMTENGFEACVHIDHPLIESK